MKCLPRGDGLEGTAIRRRPLPSPAVDQDDDPADDPRCSHRSRAEEMFLNWVPETFADHRGRHECDDERDQQSAARCAPTEKPLDDFDDPTPEEQQHGEDCADLDHHRVRLRHVASRVELADVHDPLRDREVASRTHRQELRDALDNAQHDSLGGSEVVRVRRRQGFPPRDIRRGRRSGNDQQRRHRNEGRHDCPPTPQSQSVHLPTLPSG